MTIADDVITITAKTIPPKRSRKASTMTWVLGALSVLATAMMFTGLLTREAIAACAIVLMIALVMLNIPVAVALTVPGVLGLIAIRGWTAGFAALADIPFESMASWSLSVLPMFIFMGMLLWRSGLTTKLFDAAHQWLHWLPGGLAASTVGAGAGLAAMSGSTIGTTHALARVAAPEMIRAGYPKHFVTGSLALSGLPGQLIPPSMTLIIYAGIAEVAVGPQLIAGILPGVLIAVICILQIIIMGAVSKKLRAATAAVGQSPTWGSRFRSIGPIWPLPVLIVIVIGGMMSGAMTATEAGSAGALGALIILVVAKLRDGAIGAIGKAVASTLTATGSIFFLLIGAHFLTRMFQMSGLGAMLTEWISALGLNATTFLLLMFVVYILLGMVMDPLAMMLLTVPLLIPTLNALEIPLIWFGVFAVFLGELAILTPPVGILTYVLQGILSDKEISLGTKFSVGDIVKSLGWFAPAIVLFVLLLIFFPQLVMFLPSISAQ
ncbi:TRAP transporter large permease [Microbacterium sp. NPDC096154]|uniref:TRAP transporter large permease n=1 Tax=Microbacterium sp. NPDC096154 TaxID=3155549 RepID=UPI0033259F98